MAHNPNFGRRLRPYLIAGIVGFIIMEIVALSPSSLEQEGAIDSQAVLTEEMLLPDKGAVTLAAGIPLKKVPDYSVDGFTYVSVQGGLKQWKLVADRAYLYNKEKLVHARSVTAYLYDGEKITVVRGLEAKYFMDKQDLEVFGSVRTAFPDGFRTESEYLKYKPNTKHVDIPENYFVTGQGSEKEQQRMDFQSYGLTFSMNQSMIVLPKDVRVTMTRKPNAKDSAAGVAEKTTIESDHCAIDRSKQLARFTMYEKRDIKSRFVRINQPGMFVRARRADLNYGDFDQVLQYLTAYEDVFIQELPKTVPAAATLAGNPPSPAAHPSYRYGTGGRADFDTHRNVIILREFPQVYQDNDTVTGDVIIVHRDTDIVEVEHSNAYSGGNK